MTPPPHKERLCFRKVTRGTQTHAAETTVGAKAEAECGCCLGCALATKLLPAPVPPGLLDHVWELQKKAQSMEDPLWRGQGGS